MENLKAHYEAKMNEAEQELRNIETLNRLARLADWDLLKKGLREVRKLGIRARLNLSDDISSTMSELDRFLETVTEDDKVMYSSHQFTSTLDVIKQPPSWHIEDLEPLYEYFNFSTEHDDFEWVRDAVRVLQDEGLNVSWSGLISDCVRVQLGFSRNQIERMKRYPLDKLKYNREKYWEVAA